MMDIDGITVIDNHGRIRAFNIFIHEKKNDDEKNDKVGGGARKRAANALLNINNPNILGVYFQSQDGNLSYRRNENE